MLDLIDEPDLLDRLSELDSGIADSESRPYVPPPPLMDRLLIPEARGWRSNALHGPANGGVVDHQAREEFDNLDRGLLESSATADSVFARQVQIIEKGRRQHVIHPHVTAQPIARRTASPWLTGAWLMVFAMLGATGAGVVFHDRVTTVIARIEARLK